MGRFMPLLITSILRFTIASLKIGIKTNNNWNIELYRFLTPSYTFEE